MADFLIIRVSEIILLPGENLTALENQNLILHR